MRRLTDLLIFVRARRGLPADWMGGGVRDLLAWGPAFHLWVPVGPGVAGGWWSGRDLNGVVVGEDVVPQLVPRGGVGPVGGQVERGSALRAGEPGGHVDQVPAQRGTTGDSHRRAGQGAGSAEQVVG